MSHGRDALRDALLVLTVFAQPGCFSPDLTYEPPPMLAILDIQQYPKYLPWRAETPMGPTSPQAATGDPIEPFGQGTITPGFAHAPGTPIVALVLRWHPDDVLVPLDDP